MSNTDKIDVLQLKKTIDRLLEHLREGGMSEIALSKDYYHSIGGPAVYDVATEPSDINIGSLFDGWEGV